MKPQTALLDGDVGPDPRQQIPLADDLVRAAHQCDQDIERPRADLDGRAILCQEPFARDEPERTK